MKAKKQLVREVKDEKEMLEILLELSINEGGAWVFSVKPFSHIVTFEMFQNPSSVPDHFHDLTKNTMAHEGKLRPFTKAAKRRERNRGLGSR